jgi:phosphoenolpyruvate-protein kinase (PTS system EI component)
VARECALPLVTGLPNAWMRIREGQTLRVDGDAGTVECFDS